MPAWLNSPDLPVKQKAKLTAGSRKQANAIVGTAKSAASHSGPRAESQAEELSDAEHLLDEWFSDSDAPPGKDNHKRRYVLCTA